MAIRSNTAGARNCCRSTRYPIAPQTKLVAHVGYTQVKNFKQVTTYDYKLGVAHTRWGLDFELDAVAARMRDRSYAVTYDVYGHTNASTAPPSWPVWPSASERC